MSAALVAVVVTSGERHEGKAGMVLFAWVKLCDPCLSTLCVPWCKKALYKYSSFPLLNRNSQAFALRPPTACSLVKRPRSTSSLLVDRGRFIRQISVFPAARVQTPTLL